MKHPSKWDTKYCNKYIKFDQSQIWRAWQGLAACPQAGFTGKGHALFARRQCVAKVFNSWRHARETGCRLCAAAVIGRYLSSGASGITEESNQPLNRTQRRLLRRICNGRTVPLVVGGTPIQTYKEACRYLVSLPADARDLAYEDMKRAARIGAGTTIQVTCIANGRLSGLPLVSARRD